MPAYRSIPHWRRLRPQDLFATGRLAGLLLVLIATGNLVGGCSADQAGKGPKTNGDKAVVVTLATARKADVPNVIHATGQVEALATVGIKSQINGTLETVHCREGQEVRRGDLLFTIDRRPYQAELKSRQAALAKSRVELANAEKTYKRYLPAAQKGYISAEQADEAATALAGLQATILVDEAAVETARLNLDYCVLSAPLAGVIGEIDADPGSLVKANADTPLLTINQIAPLSIAFAVPGRQLTELRRHTAAGTLTVTAMPAELPGSNLTGQLRFIDNSIDPTTGTILVKADFANTGRELWPGQTVAVSLQLSLHRDAILVPSQAVQIGQDGAYVYVARDDKTVSYRRVTAGAVSGVDTIIESGLAVGDKVVTNGHLQLVDGGKIVEAAAANKKGGDKAQQGAKP